MNMGLFLLCLATLVPAFAESFTSLNAEQVKAWALRQGTVQYEGRTEDGRECEFNIFIRETPKSIYLSLGQRLPNAPNMVYLGGFLDSTGVTGQRNAEGHVADNDVAVEFEGKGADDQHPDEDVRSKIQLERGPSGTGIIKATGSSTLSDEFVCRFIAAVS